jgi:hypothetical protein
VTGGWRNFHNEDLHDFYCSPNVITMIKLRRLRWTGYVAHLGEMRSAHTILVGEA